MKTKQFPILLLIVSAVLMLGSCKKDNSDRDDSISAEDNSNVSESMNASTDDAANAVGGYQELSGKTDGLVTICGADIDTSQKAQGIITINYNGTNCNGISRTGSITATLVNYPAMHWKDAGATLQLQFNQVVVSKVATGSHFTLSGVHMLVNESGGLAWKVLDGLATGPVVHRHTASNFSLTLPDGSARTWSVNRVRTFVNLGSTRTVTVSSDHTENGVSNVAMWGTNRNGETFVNSIITPIVSTNVCGWHKPIEGEWNHNVANRNAHINFGVDASGDAVTTGCAWGLKITYTRNNVTKTRLVSYWF